MVPRVMRDLTILAILAFSVGCGPTPRGGHDDDGTGDGGLMGQACSSDLHEVLDGNGNVIGTCPPDQGCAGGVCVPACQAAAASQGSVGCDFVVATPSFYPTISPPCFAVFLANNWPLDSAVTITRGGPSYDAATIGRVPNGRPNAASWPPVPTTGIASSDVGVLFLGSDPSANNAGIAMTCPVTPAVASAGGSAIWTGGTEATGIGTA